MSACELRFGAPSVERAREAFNRALRDLIEAYVVDECWRLHQAAPSAPGWRQLASYEAATARADAVRRDAFGGVLEVATATLAQAIAEETDDARRVVMASWLARLAE